MAPGYVYILVNPSMPGLVKIGRTLRDARTRARELSSTSVPTPFQVAFELFAEQHEALETRVHQALTDFRVDAAREFFSLSTRQGYCTASGAG
ncbi:GIY-YIG nuclease family protein [Burkholderia pseudomallei]|uniref:GIY-YIG nuclease family protein n=1 Tax=Burkholderia pseudomallei TaxID=28450 RepID=UPI0018DB9871